MKALNPSQRKYLRSQAHHLNSVVQIGKGGVTASLVQTVAEALDAHELIKIRFIEFKESRKELTSKIAQKSGAQVVGLIGNVAMLYKQHPDPEKRKIQLP
ncbi:MAG: ribosome assembly RNA-binding protein YhbY [bacterium]|nr:ribosome assembly RNA-binding protein YhbY [bacterium]